MGHKKKIGLPGGPNEMINDSKGQWNHPGENTRIEGSDITMDGVSYPVWAQPNVGAGMMMFPDQNYSFPGAQYVDEYPVAQDGIEVPKRQGVRKNPDGSVSSHLMRTETLDGENWFSFPSLFQDEDGTWIDMSEEEDWMRIYEEAKKRNEVIDFGTDKEAAIKFGEGSWKPKMQKGGTITHNDTTYTVLHEGDTTVTLQPVSGGSVVHVDMDLYNQMKLGELYDLDKKLTWTDKPMLEEDDELREEVEQNRIITPIQQQMIDLNKKREDLQNFLTPKEKGGDVSWNFKGKTLPKAQIGNIGNIVKNISKLAEPVAKKVIKNADDWDSSVLRYLNTTDPGDVRAYHPNWGKWNKSIPDNKELLEEYDIIEQATRANDTYMKNLDGSVFKGTPEQFIQSKSTNFKNAYPEGVGLTYRGTYAGHEPYKSVGSIFTADKKGAIHYGSDHVFKSIDDPGNLSLDGYKKGSGHFQFYYPPSKNVLNIDAKGSGFRNLPTKTIEGFKIPDAPEYHNLYNELRIPNQKIRTTEDIARILEQSNIDYSNIKNVLDGTLLDEVIYNNQKGRFLKSTWGNDGMFDLTNKNPFQQKGGELPKAQLGKLLKYLTPSSSQVKSVAKEIPTLVDQPKDIKKFDNVFYRNTPVLSNEMKVNKNLLETGMNKTLKDFKDENITLKILDDVTMSSEYPQVADNSLLMDVFINDAKTGRISLKNRASDINANNLDLGFIKGGDFPFGLDQTTDAYKMYGKRGISQTINDAVAKNLGLQGLNLYTGMTGSPSNITRNTKLLEKGLLQETTNPRLFKLNYKKGGDIEEAQLGKVLSQGYKSLKNYVLPVSTKLANDLYLTVPPKIKAFNPDPSMIGAVTKGPKPPSISELVGNGMKNQMFLQKYMDGEGIIHDNAFGIPAAFFDNPMDAGRGFNALKGLMKKGDLLYGHGSGSLSTDSYKNFLKRGNSNDFDLHLEYDIDKMIPINTMGKEMNYKHDFTKGIPFDSDLAKNQPRWTIDGENYFKEDQAQYWRKKIDDLIISSGNKPGVGILDTKDQGKTTTGLKSLLAPNPYLIKKQIGGVTKLLKTLSKTTDNAAKLADDIPYTDKQLSNYNYAVDMGVPGIVNQNPANLDDFLSGSFNKRPVYRTVDLNTDVIKQESVISDMVSKGFNPDDKLDVASYMGTNTPLEVLQDFNKGRRSIHSDILQGSGKDLLYTSDNPDWLIPNYGGSDPYMVKMFLDEKPATIVDQINALSTKFRKPVNDAVGLTPVPQYNLLGTNPINIGDVPSGALVDNLYKYGNTIYPILGDFGQQLRQPVRVASGDDFFKIRAKGEKFQKGGQPAPPMRLNERPPSPPTKEQIRAERLYNYIAPTSYSDPVNIMKMLGLEEALNNPVKTRTKFTDPRSEEFYKQYLGLPTEGGFLTATTNPPTNLKVDYKKTFSPNDHFFKLDEEMENAIYEIATNELKDNKALTLNQDILNDDKYKHLITKENSTDTNNLFSGLNNFTVRKTQNKAGEDIISYIDRYDFPMDFIPGTPFGIYGEIPVKKEGGESDNPLDTYKKYVLEELTTKEDREKGKKIYDKLNRVYYKDAKKMNMNPSNYIMTHLITN